MAWKDSPHISLFTEEGVQFRTVDGDTDDLVPRVQVDAKGTVVEFGEEAYVFAHGLVEAGVSMLTLTATAQLAVRGISVVVDEVDAEAVVATRFRPAGEFQRRRLSAKALRVVGEAITAHGRAVVTDSDVVVVLGSGGREHAIALKLAESTFVGSVLVVPGNGGTATAGGKIKNVPDMSPSDTEAILGLVKKHHPRLVIIGPEQPLADGIVDALERHGVACFGPGREGAMLEASKAWSKAFMERHGIPTPTFRCFTDVEAAVAHTVTVPYEVVVKASGLAGGKGVLLPAGKNEAVAAVRAVMSGQFGSAGAECIVEERLVGEEVTVLAFCDGNTAVCMPGAQDHKRVGEGDTGANTGGMGAYAPAPVLEADPVLKEECFSIVQRTLDALNEEGIMYVGVLYVGLMIVDGKPVVLEYNCRLGDPEAQVLLPLLASDLYEIALHCTKGTLDMASVEWKPAVAATVVCSAPGYPEAYPLGSPISLPANLHTMYPTTIVYHAGTVVDGTALKTAGGRVFAITGVGSSLRSALAASYAVLPELQSGWGRAPTSKPRTMIGFDGMHYRRDIGWRGITAPTRVGILGSTRGTDVSALVAALNTPGGAIYGKAELVVCVSNKPDSGILERARAHGVRVECIQAYKGESRSHYDARLSSILHAHRVDLVLCIGWMRILSKDFTDAWAGCCLNVHPSLLPDFAGGMDVAVHQAVLDAGRSRSGCTVHQVTALVDGGPIVVQKSCEVLSTDTVASLKERVQTLEGEAMVEAVAQFTAGVIGPLASSGWYAMGSGGNGAGDGCGEVAAQGLTYKSAGVNIDAGHALVQKIKPLMQRTRRTGGDTHVGGFGGLFDLAAAGYGAVGELLVASADGVGTKMKIAQECGTHDTVGIDLVAMNTNDIVACGAEPLFFLDYFATGVLDVEVAAKVVAGIAEGCVQSGCALIGGETAEMAGMYSPGVYDLAGVAVGAVRRTNLLPAPDIGPGDLLLGLPSDGIHSNGFSLVRKCVEKSGLKWDAPCPWAHEGTLGMTLLQPTKIYVKALLPLIGKQLIKGAAHITGGGILDNLPRVLPAGVCADVHVVSSGWTLPPVFKWLQSQAQLPQSELLRTFNCGVGMVLVLAAERKDEVVSALVEAGETPMMLGVLREASDPALGVVNIIGTVE